MERTPTPRRFGDDLDREVTTFKPEKEDRLIGRVTSVEWVDSRFGPDTYPLLEIESEDGRLFQWHAAQAVAKSAVRRKNVRVGDQIAIKCLGDHPKGYRDFRIIVDHAGANPDQSELFDSSDDHREPPDDDYPV